MTGEISVHHAARLCKREREIAHRTWARFQPCSTYGTVAAGPLSSFMLRFSGSGLIWDLIPSLNEFLLFSIDTQGTASFHADD